MLAAVYRMSLAAASKIAARLPASKTHSLYCAKGIVVGEPRYYRWCGSFVKDKVRRGLFSRTIASSVKKPRKAGVSVETDRFIEMEVTSSNFKQSLPEVEKALQDCVFFAYDCEFTGLQKEDGRQLYLDDMEDRYKQMVASSQSFLINQFGLSAFTPNAAGGYTARTFNFYLFPRPCEGYDKRFMCQASSLDFLAKQGFDFNKFVREGISNMPLECRDYKLQQMEVIRERSDILIRKPVDVAFVADLKEKVAAWLKGTDKVLNLGEVNSYLRAIQYQQLDKDQFGAANGDGPGFYVERVDDVPGRPALQLVRATAEEVEMWKEAQKEMKKEVIREATGFSVVLELIRDSGKPAVGHNLSLDLAYSIASFVQQLPASWSDYKDIVQRWFPGGLYDTKYLALQLAQNMQLNTALDELYLGLTEGTLWKEMLAALQESGKEVDSSVRRPTIEHAPGFTRYVGASVEEFSHEAGYDAFMTGAVFCHMMALYDVYHGHELEEGEEEGPMALGAVREAMGRMNMMRSDFPYAALYGPDPTPDRSHIFVLTNVLPGTRTADISVLVDKAEIGSVRVTVPYGTMHAFLEVQDEEIRDKIVEKFSALDDFPYEVMSYADWKAGKDFNMAGYFGDIDGNGGLAENAELGPGMPPKRRRAAT